MQHYAPHAGSAFEGHYSKLDLPSGAKLALILCTVPGASSRSNLVSLTYVPNNYPTTTKDVFQREIWAKEMHMVKLSSTHFEIRVPGIGRVECKDNLTTYDIDVDDFKFFARTTSHTPWSRDTITPEGLLVNLPLPLHWHVHSLSSQCNFSLEIRSSPSILQLSDGSGIAYVHEEKNWSQSFPAAHIWIQARNHSTNTGIAIAGGKILGMEAYLLGYRANNQMYHVDCRPPVAIRLAGWYSPLMAVRPNWESRSFDLSVRVGWNRMICIKASAPEGTFVGLSAPFAQGHRPNFLGESFKARVSVEIRETPWLSLSAEWKTVHKEVFEDASLEFGGEYYAPAGSEQIRN